MYKLRHCYPAYCILPDRISRTVSMIQSKRRQHCRFCRQLCVCVCVRVSRSRLKTGSGLNACVLSRAECETGDRARVTVTVKDWKTEKLPQATTLTTVLTANWRRMSQSEPAKRCADSLTVGPLLVRSQTPRSVLLRHLLGETSTSELRKSPPNFRSPYDGLLSPDACPVAVFPQYLSGIYIS